MGDLLGARHTETDVLTDNGQVDFKKVANLPSFKQGISRLIKGMEKYRIALMCSERDPMTCHRFGLISKVLTDNNVEVLHITTDRVIPEKELEDKIERYQYLILELTLEFPALFLSLDRSNHQPYVEGDSHPQQNCQYCRHISYLFDRLINGMVFPNMYVGILPSHFCTAS